MGKSINRMCALGNVGKDPEMRSTGAGTLVANFSIACSDRRKDAQGNWQDQTEWINVTAFGRTAEIVRDYVTKGSKVYIEGKLQTQQWEKDGQKHYKTVVLVNELVLLSGGKESRQEAATGYSSSTTAEVDDSEVPF